MPGYDVLMAKKARQDKSKPEHARQIRNRRATFDYHVLAKIECGMALTGTETKSLRAGNANLEGAFARIRDGQVWLSGCNIAIYPMAAGSLQHDPLRERRLLLHKRQINELVTHLQQKGHTLIPLALYFKNGWAKCELGVAVGKKTFDKRETIRKRQQERETSRAVGRRKYGRE